MTDAEARNLRRLMSELRRLRAKERRASDARFALPAGSTRAKVTTVNARWMTAAEARDRAEAALRAEVERLKAQR